MIYTDLKFLEQLKRHEGAVRNAKGRHVAYRCPAGKLTIGYGHNLEDNPIKGVNASSKLTEEDANAILHNDVLKAETAMYISLPWTRDLDEPRLAVLVNMVFNMGMAGLLSFKNTLRHIRLGEWKEASDGMLASKWHDQVGKRAEELARQMRTGEWQTA